MQNLYLANSKIFERKIRNVIRETTSLSPETKAHILLIIQDEFEGRDDWGRINDN